MSEMSVKQAYSILVALKSNLPGGVTLHQKYVDQFHSVLDTLEKESGQNLDAFRVPVSEMRRRAVSKNEYTGVTYTETPEVDRPFLMLKIDAILGFFTIEQERKAIGFHAR